MDGQNGQNGQDGQNGQNGQDGQDGLPGALTVNLGAEPVSELTVTMTTSSWAPCRRSSSRSWIQPVAARSVCAAAMAAMFASPSRSCWTRRRTATPPHGRACSTG
ncbi:MAG: hypothetical protein HC923_04030 [Myxococcales bacterium]|nr:hypothetical protein [Myxococcales bacterium]